MKHAFGLIYLGVLRVVERSLRWLFPKAVVMVLPEGKSPELCHGRTDPLLYRAIVAQMYLRGEGIEIGALHQPLFLPKWAKVHYVDHMSVEDLKKHYPESKLCTMAPVDVIDDGATLATIADFTQDFVIANSILEHFSNPLGAICNMMRVLKRGGILYMAIPDKRYIFDRARPTTTYTHMLDDYRAEVPDDKAHFVEWVKYLDPQTDEAASLAKVDALRAQGYSIHYHVWTQTEILDIIAGLQRDLHLQFHVKMVYSCNDEETMVVLQKA